MRGMRYQPQGRMGLRQTHPLVRRAQAILLGASDRNLVSGVPLITTGSGVGRRATPGGIADSFRKNFFRKTEMLPAIGTQPFVEFWVGVPNSSLYNSGGNGDCGFLTGSSNNSTGIAGTAGTQKYGATPTQWGAVTDWNATTGGPLALAGESLTPGVLVCLVVARYADRMELWRNGVLVSTSTKATANHGASRFIVGAFIEDAGYWASSGDMLMAGRVLASPSVAELASFGRNPWQIFVDPEEDDEFVLPAAVSGSITVTPASLLLGGGEVAMRVTRRIGVQAAGMSATGGDVALRAARKLGVQPAPSSLTPGEAMLRADRRFSVQPAAASLAFSEVGLRAARRMAASAAALAIEPRVAQLRASRRLTVAPVAMAVSSGSIQFQYTPAPSAGSYVMPVTSAALALTGGNVSMRVTRRVSVAAAALGLSAGDVRLLAGYRLSVAPAALTVVTGQALLRADRRLQIEPAQLAVTGGAATLRYSQQIEYARAPVGAGYSPQRVEVQARPAQLGGSRPASIQRNVR